jgi:hypothetical protein
MPYLHKVNLRRIRFINKVPLLNIHLKKFCENHPRGLSWNGPLKGPTSYFKYHTILKNWQRTSTSVSILCVSEKFCLVT